jgi:hypothetical protein
VPVHEHERGYAVLQKMVNVSSHDTFYKSEVLEKIDTALKSCGIQPKPIPPPLKREVSREQEEVVVYWGRSR